MDPNQQDQPSQPEKQSSTPVQSNQSSNLAPSSLNNWIKFLVIFLVLAVLGLGRYVFLGKKENKTIMQNPRTSVSPTIVQPSPVPDPTANWKTYTNTSLGFNLKYPAEWVNYNTEGG